MIAAEKILLLIVATCSVVIAQESATVHGPELVKSGKVVDLEISVDAAPNFEGGSVMVWVSGPGAFDVQSGCGLPRFSDLRLVAGGGFVPQSPTDSLELADSTMVRNAENGYKGNFLIQFSFSFASVGVGHDLRAAVDSSKAGFGTPEAGDKNKNCLSVSFSSAAPVFNRENRQTRWLPEER